MEVYTRKDIARFADDFFENHPNIKINSNSDRIKAIHDLLVFGIDCMAIGREEGFTAGREIGQEDVLNSLSI